MHIIITIILIEVHGNLIKMLYLHIQKLHFTSGMKNQTARGLARSRTLPRHVVGFRHSPALIPGFTMLQGVVEEVSRSRELLKVSEGKVMIWQRLDHHFLVGGWVSTPLKNMRTSNWDFSPQGSG